MIFFHALLYNSQTDFITKHCVSRNDLTNFEIKQINRKNLETKILGSCGLKSLETIGSFMKTEKRKFVVCQQNMVLSREILQKKNFHICLPNSKLISYQNM